MLPFIRLLLLRSTMFSTLLHSAYAYNSLTHLTNPVHAVITLMQYDNVTSAINYHNSIDTR